MKRELINHWLVSFETSMFGVQIRLFEAAAFLLCFQLLDQGLQLVSCAQDLLSPRDRLPTCTTPVATKRIRCLEGTNNHYNFTIG